MSQLGTYLTFINLTDKDLKLIIHNTVRTLIEGELTESSINESDGGMKASLNVSVQPDGPHLGGGLSGELRRQKNFSSQVHEKYTQNIDDSELIVNKKSSKSNIKIPISSTRCSIYEIKELNGEKEILLKNVPFFQPYTYYCNSNNNELTSFGENIQKSHNVMIECSINGEIKCLTYAGNKAILNGSSPIKLEKVSNEEIIKVEEPINIISISTNYWLSYRLYKYRPFFKFLKLSVEYVKFLPQEQISTAVPPLENGAVLAKWIIRKVPQSFNNSNNTKVIKEGEDIVILLDTTDKYLQVDHDGNVICDKFNSDHNSNAQWKIRIFRDEI